MGTARRAPTGRINKTGDNMQINVRNQKGFTLIELVVVMVILALLAAVAIPKFLDLQKQAEAASVKKVIGNIRSALSLRVARALVEGENLAELAGNPAVTANTLYPMDVLSNIPEPYSGRTGGVPVTDKGAWFEGATSHDLYYILKNTDIVSDPTDPAYIRYEIEVVKETVNGVLTDVGLVFETYDGVSTIDVGITDDADFDWNY